MENYKIALNFLLNKFGYLFGMFVFFPNKTKPYLILILFLVSCILFKTNDFKLLLRKGLPLLVLFLTYSFSLFYTQDLSSGIDLLIRMTPFIILPFTFSLMGIDNTQCFFNKFKKAFIYSLVIYTLFIFLYLYKLDCLLGSNNLNYGYSFIMNEFYGINDHPIYISSYLCLGLFIIINDKKTNKYLSFFAFVIISLGLIILSRKGSIIAFILSLVYYLVVNKNQFFKPIFILISFFTLIFFIPEINKRFLELTNSKNPLNTSTGLRQAVFKNAIQLTSNSKFFGFGVGDVQKELNKQYFDNKFNLLAKDKYNAHNQYIQIVLTVGYIGLFIFLVALIYCTYNLHLMKDYFGVTILIFFSIFFNTESYLERQNGIFFFSLILCLLNFSEQTLVNKSNFLSTKNE